MRPNQVFGDAAVRKSFHVKANSALNEIVIVNQFRRLVDCAKQDNLRIENFANLVADEIIDRLHIELCSKTLLDAIDNGEFGLARDKLMLTFGERGSARTTSGEWLGFLL